MRTSRRTARRIAVAHSIDAAQHAAHRAAALRLVAQEHSAQSAGDSVSALRAEISMATLMVTANWRNN